MQVLDNVGFYLSSHDGAFRWNLCDEDGECFRHGDYFHPTAELALKDAQDVLKQMRDEAAQEWLSNNPV